MLLQMSFTKVEDPEDQKNGVSTLLNRGDVGFGRKSRGVINRANYPSFSTA